MTEALHERVVKTLNLYYSYDAILQSGYNPCDVIDGEAKYYNFIFHAPEMAILIIRDLQKRIEELEKRTYDDGWVDGDKHGWKRCKENAIGEPK